MFYAFPDQPLNYQIGLHINSFKDCVCASTEYFARYFKCNSTILFRTFPLPILQFRAKKRKAYCNMVWLTERYRKMLQHFRGGEVIVSFGDQKRSLREKKELRQSFEVCVGLKQKGSKRKIKLSLRNIQGVFR